MKTTKTEMLRTEKKESKKVFVATVEYIELNSTAKSVAREENFNIG